MDTSLAVATPAPLAPQRRAVITLHNQQVAVRLDADGFLRRVERRIKLLFGTELYSACKGTPGNEEKVMPYQPGYMKLVAAMGGQLLCPPAVRDPVSGEMRANPIVETYPGSGIVRAVTATAIAAVRDEVTGEWHASIQTIRVDAEHVLRQALLKINREDCVRIMSDEEISEERRSGGSLKGWTVIPLTPPFANIVANFKMEGVRDAFSTFTNMGATLRQRACTKAERLACDHNPVLRRVWTYGELTHPGDWVGDGDARRFRKLGEPYADISVVTWVETRGKPEMDAFIAQLAAMQDVAGVTSVVGQIVSGAPDEEIDADAEDDVPRPVETPRLTDAGPRRDIIDIPPERGPVPVAAPVEASKAAPVAPPVAAAPAAPTDPGAARFIKAIQKYRAALVGSPAPDAYAETLAARGLAPAVDLATLPTPTLMTIRDVLQAVVEGFDK